MTSLPLSDVRVLDFTHAAAGPFTTMFLADMGAEVWKVEKPGRGDGSRYMGEPVLGELQSDYYLSLNRSKKSILIDLATHEGREIATGLAARADVVVQNFRPGVMDRLGLGYDELRKIRRGLVYCSISAFGASGPWRNRPANDIIMQSVSGLMGITGEEDGGPVRIGAPVSDFSTGLFALAGILSALYSRDDYPEGQHIEVPMLDSSIAMMANYIPAVASLGKTIPRLGRGHAQIVPYQAFKCSDGEYVMVGAFTNAFWQRLCEAVDRPKWIEDDRYTSNAARVRHRDELLSELGALFLARSREDWLEILEAHDVPSSPVLELHEAVRSEQAIHNEVVQKVREGDVDVAVVNLPVRSDRWSALPPSMPPRMGADSRDILTSVLGMSSDRIEELLDNGIIDVERGG